MKHAGRVVKEKKIKGAKGELVYFLSIFLAWPSRLSLSGPFDLKLFDVLLPTKASQKLLTC